MKWRKTHDLMSQIKDINDSDERATYVGLRHEF